MVKVLLLRLDRTSHLIVLLEFESLSFLFLLLFNEEAICGAHIFLGGGWLGISRLKSGGPLGVLYLLLDRHVEVFLATYIPHISDGLHLFKILFSL